MALYELEFNGKRLELEANTPEQAATAARLYFAGRGRAEDIETSRGAEAQTAEARTPLAAAQRATAATMTDPEALGAGFLGATGPGAAAGTLGAAALMTPPGLALARDIGIYKAAEGAEKALGLPRWTGEIIGAVSPARSLGKLLLGGAFGGAKKAAVGAAEGVAAKKGAEISAEAAELQAIRIAREKARLEGILADNARKAEIHAKRLAGELPPRARGPKVSAKPAKPGGPDVTMPPTPAAEVSPPRVLPKGQKTMATNLGGKAKPGPPATPPDEIEAALESSLRAPRIQVGAQKVGRAVGMTKEQVRMEAGPVLDEIRGLASPILPKKALRSIVDKMRSIPMEQREAYVQAATSGKAKWQVENIRRTLEHLGLLIPAGAAARVASEQ